MEHDLILLAQLRGDARVDAGSSRSLWMMKYVAPVSRAMLRQAARLQSPTPKRIRRESILFFTIG